MVFKEYQDYLKSMLLFFDSFCRENDIKYSACCGTLLGLIRHSDIIPWDGDVDVAMTRKEYTKLVAAFKNYNGRFYLEDMNNRAIKHGCKKDFVSIHSKLVDKKCNSALYCIDIYTLDFLGDDYLQARYAVRKYKKYYQYAKFFLSFHLPAFHTYNGLLKNALILFIHFIHPICYIIYWITMPFFKRKFNRFQDEYLSFEENSRYFTLIPYYLKNIDVEENSFKKYLDFNFGNFKVMAFDNYKLILEKSYGEYLKLPPEEKRKPYPSEMILTKIDIEMDDEMRCLYDRIRN